MRTAAHPGHWCTQNPQFEGLKVTYSPGSCLLYSHRHWAVTAGYPRFPDLRPIGTPIPVSRPKRETGDFPIPVPGRVGNRKFPLRFPAKSGRFRGNGNRGLPGQLPPRGHGKPS
jgi:hypothetical protein